MKQKKLYLSPISYKLHHGQASIGTADRTMTRLLNVLFAASWAELDWNYAWCENTAECLPISFRLAILFENSMSCHAGAAAQEFLI